jgi:hypothetical protein
MHCDFHIPGEHRVRVMGLSEIGCHGLILCQRRRLYEVFTECHPIVFVNDMVFKMYGNDIFHSRRVSDYKFR